MVSNSALVASVGSSSANEYRASGGYYCKSSTSRTRPYRVRGAQCLTSFEQSLQVMHDWKERAPNNSLAGRLHHRVELFHSISLLIGSALGAVR
jgi:hypothetical protein